LDLHIKGSAIYEPKLNPCCTLQKPWSSVLGLDTIIRDFVRVLTVLSSLMDGFKCSTCEKLKVPVPENQGEIRSEIRSGWGGEEIKTKYPFPLFQ
jgi:hypothetical protein